jgi:hypothetical protein
LSENQPYNALSNPALDMGSDSDLGPVKRRLNGLG